MNNKQLLFARVFWWIDYIMQMLAYLLVMFIIALVFALILIALANSTASGVSKARIGIGIMMKVFVVVWTYLYLKFLATIPNYPKEELKLRFPND